MKLTRLVITGSIAFALTACLGTTPLRPDIDMGSILDLGAVVDWGNALNLDPDLSVGGRLNPHLPETEKAEEIPTSELAEKLKVGDDARVTTTWNKTYLFRVYRVGDSEFAGLTVNDKKYRVQYDTISKVTVRRQKPGGHVLFEYLMCSVAFDGEPQPGAPADAAASRQFPRCARRG